MRMLSRSTLLWIFIAALLLFAAIRLQPEAWLRSQIDQLASAQGITLHYDRLALHGTGLSLTHCTIQNARMRQPLVLDQLQVLPHWLSLLTTPAAHIEAARQGVHAALDAALQADQLTLQAIHASASAADLQQLLQGMVQAPVPLAGQLQLAGKATLHLADGFPQQLDLTLQWQAAAVRFPGIDKPLGDYQLHLTADGTTDGATDGGKPWAWQVSGGTRLLIDGHGSVAAERLPVTWPLEGEIKIQAAAAAPELAAMLGGKAMRFTLSGNLQQPALLPR